MSTSGEEADQDEESEVHRPGEGVEEVDRAASEGGPERSETQDLGTLDTSKASEAPAYAGASP